jgi:hypothetical protein
MPVAYELRKKRILAHFYPTQFELSAARLFINTDKINTDMIKRIFTIYVKAQDTRKSNMKPKFFLQISDHQQSVAPVPSRDLPHTPGLTLPVVADLIMASENVRCCLQNPNMLTLYPI